MKLWKNHFPSPCSRDSAVKSLASSSIRSNVSAAVQKAREADGSAVGSAVSVRTESSQRKASTAAPSIVPSYGGKDGPSYKRVLLRALIQPAMVLLLIAASVRHTGKKNPSNFTDVSSQNRRKCIFLPTSDLIRH